MNLKLSFLKFMRMTATNSIQSERRLSSFYCLSPSSSARSALKCSCFAFKITTTVIAGCYGIPKCLHNKYQRCSIQQQKEIWTEHVCNYVFCTCKCFNRMSLITSKLQLNYPLTCDTHKIRNGKLFSMHVVHIKAYNVKTHKHAHECTMHSSKIDGKQNNNDSIQCQLKSIVVLIGWIASAYNDA